MLLITNDKGREFAVVVIHKGDRYGRDFCLVNDATDKIGRGTTMVEFWDLTYGHGPVRPDSWVTGQFTGARYGLDTIMGTDGYGSGEGGLCLDGGNRDVWSIDADAMAEVRGWLSGVRV